MPTNKEIKFKNIAIEQDFGHCLRFRRDSYFCSFQTYIGYEASVQGYEERMHLRLQDPRWHYVHLWDNNNLVGQLEFRSYSDFAHTGYVHLIYLIPAYRGTQAAAQAQDYIAQTLVAEGCTQAILSVSPRQYTCCAALSETRLALLEAESQTGSHGLLSSGLFRLKGHTLIKITGDFGAA